VGALAAEAFSAITGLELVGRYVRERDEADADDEAPPEEPASPLWPGLDADLPRPVANEVQGWWTEARQGFDDGTRYLDGRPFSADRLVDALEAAPMRRRGPLALELALRSAGAFVVEPYTWARAQLRQLEAVRAGTGQMQLRPFTSWCSR
jgi:hypothetical protein